MKSLIKEALAKAEADMKSTPVKEPVPLMETEEDKELEEVLKSLRTNIKVVGCGGGGSNTINRLMEENIAGNVQLIAANTDAQHLLTIKAQRKVLLGKRLTRGLGAGALPQIGQEAAREAEDKLRELLQGADMVFITCGLGGGTGTGSASVVAQIAKELGALTIAICTLPFKAEGRARWENAMWGLEKLRETADTVITIPNDKLLELVPRLPLTQAFKFADEILMRAIKGLIEMITKPGLVNLDFNDLKTIMKGGGVAMIGLGESEGTGDERVMEAIEEAINSPLLEVDISTATGVLVNVVGGPDMTISEAERAIEELSAKVSKGSRIIWGCAVDPTFDRKISVLVVATGVRSKQILGKVTSQELKDRYGVDII
ncbi:MAG: cell division protein FtsZ [Euryarchaeota archaeon]|nr:cell division protein FtsZ [Euryarchaeota archaeon]